MLGGDADHLLALMQEYLSLRLDTVVNYDRFNGYAITHHSTAIEGSTLTETETELLLEKGLTPKGKPLEHALMVRDHHLALETAIDLGRLRVLPTEETIRRLGALVMQSTGAQYNTALGTVDGSKGEYRKGNVTAGGHYFINYDKVPREMARLAHWLSDVVPGESLPIGQLAVSFRAHYDMVTIHPFYDGNGRTSRLLMNHLQAYYGLPLGRVFVEDRNAYILALEAVRKSDDYQGFEDFMFGQYGKHLRLEIDRAAGIRESQQRDHR